MRANDEIAKQQSYYLDAIVERNRKEKEFFRDFVDDHEKVMNELSETKKWLAGLRKENE